MTEDLWDRWQTPPQVRAHCRAVAAVAKELAAQVSASGVEVRGGLLEEACLLHDLVRPLGKSHPQAGAEILLGEGYADLAVLVAQHHDLQPGASVEAKLLYLADKLVEGTERVNLEQRFGCSRARCLTDEALEHWQKRYEDAQSILTQYNIKTGGPT